MSVHPTQDSQSELDELLDGYEVIETNHFYHHEHDKDKLKQAIESYVTTRVKEAERLARIDELDKYSDSALDWFYYEKTRRSELEALTTTTNGKEG
jgi:uncharacterized protein YchJ